MLGSVTGNSRAREPFAFSLVEIVVIIVIVLILAALTFPVVSSLRARAQRIQCTANLKNLYVATDLYLQQNERWPQIEINDDDEDSSPIDFGNEWIAALEPFGVSQKTWICPTIHDLVGKPDYADSENIRVDYVATPFDDKPTTPHEWPRQPWFIETGNVHGNGNLIVFTDGSVSDFNTVLKNQTGQ